MSCGGTRRAGGGSRRSATRGRRAAWSAAAGGEAAAAGGAAAAAPGERALSPRLAARLAHLRALLAAAPEPAAPAPTTFSLRAPGAAGHVAAVADCVERTAAGEIFQANLSLRLEATYAGDVAELYAHAAPQLQPAYGACFMTPWGGVASLSPELDRAELAPGQGDAAPGREVHTGAIGFASPHAGRELNVAIRTFEQHGNHLWLGAGGGIGADSDPQRELEECLAKARLLITAIGGHLHPLRNRPDAGLGVFETLLVADGIAVNLEAHLARLARSVKVLYGEALPRIDVPTDRDGAIRIDYVPGEVPATTWRELKPRALPIVVTPYVLPGGLGEHKWRDRKLLDRLSEDGTTPLILDADGAVLEAAWAAVLIKRDGNLYTPREDGRILPSTSRPRDAEERDLWLQPGDELLLSSSLAGTVPAVLAATNPAPPPGTSRTPNRTAA